MSRLLEININSHQHDVNDYDSDVTYVVLFLFLLSLNKMLDNFREQYNVITTPHPLWVRLEACSNITCVISSSSHSNLTHALMYLNKLKKYQLFTRFLEKSWSWFWKSPNPVLVKPQTGSLQNFQGSIWDPVKHLDVALRKKTVHG